VEGPVVPHESRVFLISRGGPHTPIIENLYSLLHLNFDHWTLIFDFGETM
jgi:hypothetical protein